MSYLDYNDTKGRDLRLVLQAWRESRARMIAAQKESDFGTITLYMSKHDLQARLRESAYTEFCAVDRRA